ncbi:MAG: ABC transporter ATP-binding protein [Oligoflexia bacterium]|nr:ABC transporter ATP-binding protein [Oligoflexia bacterium]
MNKILEIKNLSLSINSKNLLKNISLSINKGEFFTLVGPNGSGKSSLLKVIMGIISTAHKFKGEVLLEGKNKNIYNQKEIATIITYLPQINSSNHFFVDEFLKMSRYAHRNRFNSSKKEDENIVKQIVEVLNIGPFLGRTISSLSGGEQQKIYLAASIIQQPKLLLLDEPNTFLDPKYQYEINLLLKRINREMKVSILLATHDLNMALIQSDKILILKNGELIFNGISDDLKKSDILSTVFERKFCFSNNPNTNQIFILPDTFSDSGEKK